MRFPAAAFLLVVASLLPVVLVPFRAHAQASGTKVSQQIQQLFNQAVAEMEAGQFQAACPKLEHVVEYQPDGFGARLALAECYEGMGDFPRAWQTCFDTKLAALKAKNGKRAQDAERCMVDLDPKVAKIVLNVSDDVRSSPDLEIALDGARVELSRWGAPMAVARGEHVVVATARGRLPWRKSITLQSGGSPQPIDVDAPTTGSSASSGSNAGGSPASTGAGASGVPPPNSRAGTAQEGTASASAAQPGVSPPGTARQGVAQQGKSQGMVTQSAAQPATPLTKRVGVTARHNEDGIQSRQRALGTIALGFGGAGAFVGTVLGTISLRVEDKGNALGTASLITLATSGVLLATGGVLVLATGPSGSSANILLNPQGVSAQLRW
ncbi:tetratricopeptide repeat protein [Sorangium atrum]|uniref:Uncharacterized protein n=1 Tax=Sorangium atrum TaxID=2995308 RepID=A0ABT5C4D7_9BACT|nr:tetratricopeptide repeat protein [Sorangium aterium]MDC0680680.1 hypothetical protein [Sorangium aterium]